MRCKFYLGVLLVNFTLYLVEGANILCLNAAATHSHFGWNRVLINALAARGHNVTVLSADIDPTDKTPGAHYIHLERLYEYDGLPTLYKSEEINDDLMSFVNINQFIQIGLLYKYYEDICRKVVRSRGFKTLLDYPDDFKVDLIIFDYTYGACPLGFLHKFKYPPLIGVTPFNNPPYNLDLIGGHIYPAYIPHHSTTYGVKMTFIERLNNAFLYYLDYWYRNTFATSAMDEIVRPFFSKDMPHLSDLQGRAQLVLVNSHPATNFPEPTASNVIEVGGLQITDPEPVSEDIETFINSGKKGAIFISMGSNVNSEHLGTRRCKMILDVIADFPDYHFLWKIKENFLEKPKPANLLTKEWFPQKDILAHPKIKAFITHAGALGTHEACWFGVPMVGLPVFIDQHRNIEKSVELAIAIKVDLITMTKEDLYNAVKEVLENSKYTENIKRRSQLYRDRPMKPLDTAVWWIEYVLRNKNLDHLRSPVKNLGLIKSNLIDVIAVIVGVLTFIIVCIIISMVVRRKKKFKQSEKSKTC